MNYVGVDWGKKSPSNGFQALSPPHSMNWWTGPSPTSSVGALISVLTGYLIGGYVLLMAISTVLALMLPIKDMATRAQARLGLRKVLRSYDLVLLSFFSV